MRKLKLHLILVRTGMLLDGYRVGYGRSDLQEKAKMFGIVSLPSMETLRCGAELGHTRHHGKAGLGCITHEFSAGLLAARKEVLRIDDMAYSD